MTQLAYRPEDAVDLAMSVLVAAPIQLPDEALLDRQPDDRPAEIGGGRSIGHYCGVKPDTFPGFPRTVAFSGTSKVTRVNGPILAPDAI